MASLGSSSQVEVAQSLDTSILPYDDGRLHLEMDVSRKVYRKETIYDMYLEMYRQSRKDSDWALKRMQESIVGAQIFSTINHLCYTAVDVSTEISVHTTMDSQQYGKISHLDYYKKVR